MRVSKHVVACRPSLLSTPFGADSSHAHVTFSPYLPTFPCHGLRSSSPSGSIRDSPDVLRGTEIRTHRVALRLEPLH